MCHVGFHVLKVFDNTHPTCRAELEKLGQKYRIALRIARDERWERLKCDHKGIYADDCLVERVQKHKSKLSPRLTCFERILNRSCTDMYWQNLYFCLMDASLTLKPKSTL